VKGSIVIVTALMSAACGVVGAPIPPEDVGVAPTIQRQKQLDALEAAKKQEAEEAPVVLEPQGQDVDLPPLHPVGTR
jgi:hypothetical protein